MIDRRGFNRILAGGLLLAPSLFAGCTQPKVYRIGFVHGRENPADHFAGILSTLRDHGWIVGKNLDVQYGSGSLRGQAEELVRSKVDLIVADGTGPTMAAKEATTSIPIVMVAFFDPVGMGIAKSLAHPGGNITGYSNLGPEILAKRAELVHEALPGVQRIAFMVAQDAPGHKAPEGFKPLLTPSLDQRVYAQTATAYRSLGVEAISVKLIAPFDGASFESAFAEAVLGQAQALEVPGRGPERDTIIAAATRQKLPVLVTMPDMLDAGGLLYFAVNDDDRGRRVAAIIDKILRGANPGDIAIEQPTRFTFSINMKAAKALGITIPQSAVLRADEVIR